MILCYSAIVEKRMSKRPTTKSHKSGSKAAKAGSSQQTIRRDALAEKFIAANTGRVIKSSPAKPHLGKERIQTAVRSYVRRDSKTGRFVE
jgi:hypothetical protein